MFIIIDNFKENIYKKAYAFIIFILTIFFRIYFFNYL